MKPPEILGPRLFTLEEAEAVLPLVRDRLTRFRTLYADFELLRRDLDILRLVSTSGSDRSNPDTAALGEMESRHAGFMEAFREIQEDLLRVGCLPKSIEEGLVDFFAQKDGRLVFLCWKLGEDRIEAWHTLEGGFAGRMPIERFLAGPPGEAPA
jgi:hypothetical protein